MAEVVLDHVSKVYADGTTAVSDLNLEVGDGEFVVLVGPSGCGKTTALRMIAGLEDISGGTVRIGDTVVNGVPPKSRDVAMVFQNYALYPHLTVADNIAFGLKLRRVPKEEVRRRVDEAARILGLEQYLPRKPRALSGGQRQRVAMGRAIVREPRAFLMDEPLSNLDAKLRVGMRAQLSSLHARLGTTTIYVTHDQVEAMTLGQRVAVMRDGRVLQMDTPQALYASPVNLFVAAFIGSPSMNLVEADVEAGTVSFGGYCFAVPHAPAGRRYVVGLRPEAFEDAAFADAGLPRIDVHVQVVEDLGADAHVIFPVDESPVDVSEVREAAGDDVLLPADGALFTARVDAQTSARVGQQLSLAVDARRIHFFDPANGLRLDGAPAPALVGA